MRSYVHAALAATAALAPAGAANAAAVFVANADFEAGAPLADDQYVTVFSRSIPNWTRGTVATYGKWNPAARHFVNEASVGHVGRSDGATYEGALGQANLGQNLAGVTLQANTRYTMLVDVGNSFGNHNFEYVLGFVAGGVRPGEDGVVLAELIGSTDMFGQEIVDGQFGTVQLVFETGSRSEHFGKQFGITMGGYGGYTTYVAFDNVRVDATPLAAGVPEPSSWAMMIGGFGLIGGAMRHRTKAAAVLA